MNFIYDAWGNLYQTSQITPLSDPMPLTTPPPGPTNQLGGGFGYDIAGNMISDGSSSACTGGKAYAYDLENRMSCAKGYTFTYDGDGTRLSKSSWTMYWGGGLAETDAAGNLTAEYIPLNGKRLARKDFGASTHVHYYFTDHLGSSSVVMRDDGTTCDNDSDFYPYGGEQVFCNTLPNQHFKFTGKERDAETNLDNFGARYYSPYIGRFVSPDWSSQPEGVPYAQLNIPTSLNLYAYVNNRPTSATDLDGHSIITYDTFTQSITVVHFIVGNDGKPAGVELRSFPAGNNVDSHASLGSLPVGTYPFSDRTSPHRHDPVDDSPSGMFGSNGIFRLKAFIGADGKLHIGLGVHSGREGVADGLGRSGPQHATEGCVRTTDACTDYITQIALTDPLSVLFVITSGTLKNILPIHGPTEIKHNMLDTIGDVPTQNGGGTRVEDADPE